MTYPDGYIDDVDGCCGDVMCNGKDQIDGKDAERQGLFKCPGFIDCNTYVDYDDGTCCNECDSRFPPMAEINPFDREEK